MSSDGSRHVQVDSPKAAQEVELGVDDAVTEGCVQVPSSRGRSARAAWNGGRRVDVRVIVVAGGGWEAGRSGSGGATRAKELVDDSVTTVDRGRSTTTQAARTIVLAGVIRRRSRRPPSSDGASRDATAGGVRESRRLQHGSYLPATLERYYAVRTRRPRDRRRRRLRADRCARREFGDRGQSIYGPNEGTRAPPATAGIAATHGDYLASHRLDA